MLEEISSRAYFFFQILKRKIFLTCFRPKILLIFSFMEEFPRDDATKFFDLKKRKKKKQKFQPLQICIIVENYLNFS